jgi:hypothetical protein
MGLLVMLVMLDQRLRSPRALQLALPPSIPVMATIPHYSSTWKDRLLRKDVLFLVFVLGLFMVGYLAFLMFSVMGVTPEQLISKINELLGRGGQ